MRVRKGLKEDDLLTSVFHEMVHVKQDVRKEQFPYSIVLISLT